VVWYIQLRTQFCKPLCWANVGGTELQNCKYQHRKRRRRRSMRKKNRIRITVLFNNTANW
jgi:hypothetical protein